MRRIVPFLSGLLVGGVVLAAAVLMLLFWLPRFLVVANQPVAAAAVIVLGGDSDGSRLRRGVELVDQGWAPRLILTSGKMQGWLHLAQKHCPDCRLPEREVVHLADSVDTRTEAQVSLDYCRRSGLRNVLVVTSPYHSRRTQFVFNDIYAGSGIEPVVVTSGSFGRLVPPDGSWWRDRLTMETVWLEFGKVLYWELTPFMEWAGSDEQM